MPRKKKTEGDPAQPAFKSPEQRPTREYWRMMAYYKENIRPQSDADCVGVIRNIQRLIEKGTSIEDIAVALENYASDPWRKANPRYSKPIRSFFTAEMIQEWQTPKSEPVKPPKPIDRIAQFTSDFLPSPAVVESSLDDPPSVDDL